MIVWDPNKVIAIGEWSIWGGGCLGRFCCIYIYCEVIKRGNIAPRAGFEPTTNHDTIHAHLSMCLLARVGAMQTIMNTLTQIMCYLFTRVNKRYRPRSSIPSQSFPILVKLKILLCVCVTDTEHMRCAYV